VASLRAAAFLRYLQPLSECISSAAVEDPRALVTAGAVDLGEEERDGGGGGGAEEELGDV
jgi:hypothetical protein